MPAARQCAHTHTQVQTTTTQRDTFSLCYSLSPYQSVRRSTSHVDGSCHVHMSQVTYEQVMSHMDESCHVWMYVEDCVNRSRLHRDQPHMTAAARASATCRPPSMLYIVPAHPHTRVKYMYTYTFICTYTCARTRRHAHTYTHIHVHM